MIEVHISLYWHGIVVIYMVLEEGLGLRLGRICLRGCFVVCLKLFCELVQSLVFKLDFTIIMFEVSFTIPIFTNYLSAVEVSAMHDGDAHFSIFIFSELDLDNTFRMCFIESDTLYFANIS